MLSFLRVFHQIVAIFQAPDFVLRIRPSFCNKIFRYLIINSILFTKRQVWGSPHESPRKTFFRVFRVLCKESHVKFKAIRILRFSGSARHPAFARQVSIVFSYNLAPIYWPWYPDIGLITSLYLFIEFFKVRWNIDHYAWSLYFSVKKYDNWNIDELNFFILK